MKLLIADYGIDITEFKVADTHIDKIKDLVEFDEIISYMLSMWVVKYRDYVINNFSASLGRAKRSDGSSYTYLYTEDEDMAEEWKKWVNSMIMVKEMLGEFRSAKLVNR